MKIKQIKFYICPETGKKCKTEKEAIESAEAAIKEREEAKLTKEQLAQQEIQNLVRKDYVRLNVESIKDIPILIKEKMKEFWNIDVNIEISVCFGNVSNSHGAPIGKKRNWSGQDDNYPTSFFGWHGNVKGTLINYKSSKNASTSVNDVLFNPYENSIGFRGFHTSSGCPGSVEGKYPMDIGFYFFLEDFPKLQEKWNKYLIQRKIDLKNQNVEKEYEDKMAEFAATRPQIVEINTEINKLIQTKNNLLLEFRKQYREENKLVLETLSDDYESLSKEFLGYHSF